MSCANYMKPALCGPVYVRRYWLEAGQAIESHAHNFDHMTLCVMGGVTLHYEDEQGQTQSRLLEPGGFFNVSANRDHRIVAGDSDALVYCIYTHRDPSGEVLQHYIGWDKANQ